jgi:benzoyl-CoA reductase subunit C
MAAPAEDLYAQAEATLEDLGLGAVAAWKERTGGKVVGHFPVYAPAELLHAQGVLPVSLYGGWGRVEIDHADSRLQSFVCSITRSTLELGLTGRLGGFDGMVFTNICDVARNLSGVWTRNFPGMMMEYLHLPQNVESPSALPYFVGELERLSSSVERLSGNAREDGALRESLALYNRGRALLGEIEALRREVPWKVKATEWYLLLRLGALLPKEDHVALLESARDRFAGSPRRPRDGVRVLLLGAFCEQPPLELVRTLEDAGCFVVEDDLALGQRWYTAPVREDGDPLQRLAEAYLTASRPSSVRHHGAHPRQRNLVARAKALRVDGVVFATAKFCEPALYDYVLYKEALEAAGVPHLHLEYEEKMSAFEQPRTQVETFVESVLFE